MTFDVIFYVLSENVSVILCISRASLLTRAAVSVDWRDWVRTPGRSSHDWLMSMWCDIPCEPGVYRLSGNYDVDAMEFGGCHVVDREGNAL